MNINTDRVHPLAPIVALDIDGTLADYYGHFKWFAELYLQHPLDVKWDRATEGEFSEALGLDKNLYRQIKLAYRQGGMKRSLPPIDSGVKQLVTALRSSGIQVWICTTRPWQRLDNIDPDTQFWINRNLGRVDGVIYGEEKYLDLLDIAAERGQRVIGAIDDLPENYVAAEAAGIRVALRAGYHNRWWRMLDFGQHPRGGNEKFRARPEEVFSSEDIYNKIQQWEGKSL